jgi:Rhodanese-related sulfurtransferase
MKRTGCISIILIAPNKAMKRLFLVLTLSFSLNSLSTELWTVNELKDSISETERELVLLDVRTQSEYDSGHINNAINISHEKILESPELLAEYKDNQIVVFCRSGVRAGKVIQLLESLGFDDIIDIDGDMLAWSKAGYSVEIINE